MSLRDVIESISLDSVQRMIVESEDTRVTFEISKPLNSSKFIEKNIISPPPRTHKKSDVLRVGLMMRRTSINFWEIDNMLFPMFIIAKHFNIELLFFNPKDINFENLTVDALTLENGKKVSKTVPLPRIIDNDMTWFRGETGSIMQNLKKVSYLTRPFDNPMHKIAFYNKLSADGKFKEFLIESHTIDNFEQFLSLLEKFHNNIILKPLHGVSGKGVARVIRDDDSYIINLNRERHSLQTQDDLSNFYKKNFTDKKYILQPYIESRTRQGNPFDIRLHACRGAEGKFKVTPYPRIGNESGVVSNIAAGGYIMEFEVFLKREFGDDWKNLYDRLTDLGNTFPDYYQSFFNETIQDIGIDVGIQKREDVYELKIFEAYSQPGFKMIEIKIALNNFDYYRYIEQKLNDGTLKIG